MTGGLGISQATAYRYLSEGITALAANTSRKGKQIDAWHAGRTHDVGGLIQALTDPTGIPPWIFDVRPGSEHDVTAGRELLLGALASSTCSVPRPSP